MDGAQGRDHGSNFGLRCNCHKSLENFVPDTDIYLTHILEGKSGCCVENQVQSVSRHRSRGEASSPETEWWGRKEMRVMGPSRVLCFPRILMPNDDGICSGTKVVRKSWLVETK